MPQWLTRRAVRYQDTASPCTAAFCRTPAPHAMPRPRPEEGKAAHPQFSTASCDIALDAVGARDNIARVAAQCRKRGRGNEHDDGHAYIGPGPNGHLCIRLERLRGAVPPRRCPRPGGRAAARDALPLDRELPRVHRLAPRGGVRLGIGASVHPQRPRGIVTALVDRPVALQEARDKASTRELRGLTLA